MATRTRAAKPKAAVSALPAPDVAPEVDDLIEEVAPDSSGDELDDLMEDDGSGEDEDLDDLMNDDDGEETEELETSESEPTEEVEQPDPMELAIAALRIERGAIVDTKTLEWVLDVAAFVHEFWRRRPAAEEQPS